MVLNGSSVDASLLTAPVNRIVSGDKRSASNQPQFIDPNGAAASFVLTGNSVNLILDINGATATVSTDITKSSLTVGPSTTATCLINHASAPIAADQESTKTWGEVGAEKESITVDNMGAEMQTFIGQFCVIEIAGVATEYALAFINSATELTNVYRGYFTDSSSAPVNRTGFTNNDTITVLSTGWVFVENDGATVDVSYTTPIRSFTAPTSPATGDYWYDHSNETWKRYDGAAWQIINRTLVGVVGIDASNCVAARSFDFYGKYSETNTIDIEISSSSIIQSKLEKSKINVHGNEVSFGFNHENWNITTDLAGSADMYNATEQVSTVYYAYIKDTGETVFSDISPYYRPDLLGYYNPHNPWRCVASVFNDSGSDFFSIRELSKFNSLKGKDEQLYEIRDRGGEGSSATFLPYFNTVLTNEGVELATIVNDSTNGNSLTVLKRCVADMVFLFSFNNESAGISLNASSGSVGILSLTAPELKSVDLSNAGGYGSGVLTGQVLEIGDVISAHNGNTLNQTNSTSWSMRLRLTEI